MSTTDRLNEIEARANAATKGPWATYRDGIASPAFVNAPSTAVCEIQSDSFVREPDQGDADGSFIAHARTDVPWRIEQVRKREAALRAVLDLHRESRNDIDHTPPCPHCHGEPGVHECGCWADEKWPTVCAVCMEGTKGASVDYPCPTVRAITEALG